jgi:hypothetical protein
MDLTIIHHIYYKLQSHTSLQDHRWNKKITHKFLSKIKKNSHQDSTPRHWPRAAARREARCPASPRRRARLGPACGREYEKNQ